MQAAVESLNRQHAIARGIVELEVIPREPRAIVEFQIVTEPGIPIVPFLANTGDPSNCPCLCHHFGVVLVEFDLSLKRDNAGSPRQWMMRENGDHG